MKRHILFVSIVFLAALLLSACQTQIATSVKRDGSGELKTSMGFTADEVQMLQGLGTSSSDLCNSASQQSQLPPGATVKQEQRGDETWCVGTLPFADLSALKSAYEETKGVTVNQLDLTNGKFVYDVTVDTTGADQMAMAGTTLSLTWQLDLPGKVGSNNADSASGSTLTWDIKPGGSQTLHAESDLNAGLFSGGSSSNWIYILCGTLACCLCLITLVALVLVVVAVVMESRRKKEKGQE